MASSGGWLRDLSRKGRHFFEAIERNGFNEHRRRHRRICLGGTRLDGLSPLCGQEARRRKSQFDRIHHRRVVDADASAGVVEREIPFAPLPHEEQDVVTGWSERNPGGAGDLPGAKPPHAIDGLVDRASRDENLDVSGPARSIGIEKTRGDADAIGREHEAGGRILDPEGDLASVGEFHQPGACAPHRADDDAIALLNGLFEGQRTGRQRKQPRR